jgi:hypothetical protein
VQESAKKGAEKRAKGKRARIKFLWKKVPKEN